VGIPLTMGFRLSLSLFTSSSFFSIEFWLSRKPLTRYFSFSMGFHLSRSPFSRIFFHNGTSAITKPFSRTFSFSRWGSGYQEAFHTISLFHDGILAITEPFTRFFSYSRWNFGYQGAFHTNFFFFTIEFWLSRSLSHELSLFHDRILAIMEPFTRTFSFS
jgi:hypothetical protein